jgi:(2Fe-2S) ferredoxin
MAKFQKHIFVCTNERDPADARGCCSARGSGEVLEALKKKLSERGLKRIVRANKAGCLDQCAHGVTLVVYPEATWYGHVTAADIDAIVDGHIVGGKPLARLVLAAEQLTGLDPSAKKTS